MFHIITVVSPLPVINIVPLVMVVKRVSGRVDGRVDGRVGGGVDGRVGGRVDGRVDERVGGIEGVRVGGIKKMEKRNKLTCKNND